MNVIDVLLLLLCAFPFSTKVLLLLLVVRDDGDQGEGRGSMDSSSFYLPSLCLCFVLSLFLCLLFFLALLLYCLRRDRQIDRSRGCSNRRWDIRIKPFVRQDVEVDVERG